MTGATVLLAWRAHAFFPRHVMPGINTFINGDFDAIIWVFTYIDLIGVAVLAAAFLWVLSLLYGAPLRPRRMPAIVLAHPRIAAAPLVTVAAALLVVVPAAVYYLAVGDPKTGPNIIQQLRPRPEYLHAALWASLCFGVSIADIAAKTQRPRWWSLVFLALPTPLLWWNAVAAWIPSSRRYWAVWRPVLAAMTFAWPLSMLIAIQPAIANLPRFSHSDSDAITGADFESCYEMTRDPGRPAFYLSCSGELKYVERTPEGRWRVTRTIRPGFDSDSASIDFARNLIYIYDGAAQVMHVFDRTTHAPVATHPMEPTDVPFIFTGYKQIYDAESDTLVLWLRQGILVTLNAADFSPKTVRFFWSMGPTEQVLLDRANREILVLAARKLYVYSFPDLVFKTSTLFDEPAVGLEVDDQRRRILLGFPSIPAVVAIDRTSFAEQARGPAPVLTRRVAVDPEHNLVFAGSMVGGLGVLDATDLHPVARRRTVPGIHGFQVLPDFSDIVISTAMQRPMVWHYADPKPVFDVADRVVQLAEALRRRHWLPGPTPSTAMPPALGDERWPPTTGGYVLLAEPDRGKRETTLVWARQAGYDVRTCVAAGECLAVLDGYADARAALLSPAVFAGREAASEATLTDRLAALPKYTLMLLGGQPDESGGTLPPDTRAIPADPFSFWSAMTGLMTAPR